MKKRRLLIIFTKNPEKGKVKTRLAKDLGEQTALEIYKFLLDHSRKVTSGLDVEKQVWYSSEIDVNDNWENQIFQKRLQEGRDLGERMEHAFRSGFAEGFDQIVIIGTDLYSLTSEDIEAAFDHLEDQDFVLGPAADGGYYLLGMKSLNSKLFRNKVWSTPSVLSDSLDDLKEFQVKLLRKQNDIDVLDDIKEHPAFQKFIKNDGQN